MRGGDAELLGGESDGQTLESQYRLAVSNERFVMLGAAADAMYDNGDKIWIYSSPVHHHIKQLLTNPELDKDVITTRR